MRSMSGEPERAAGTKTGLRPAVHWLLALLLARFAFALLPIELAAPMRSAGTLLAVAGLQLASRAWCGTREMVLAALTCGGCAGMLVHDLAAPGSGSPALNVFTAVSGGAWAMFWLRCGR